jgi:O-antigen ligase
MQDPVVVAPRTRPFGDIADFYAAVWSAVRETVERWHLAIFVEVAMVVGWFAIRTVAGADGRTYFLWVIAAGVLALVSPLSGLVVLIATSAFFEPDSIARVIAPRELVVIPLAIGVLVRIALDRFRWRPEPALWIALLLLAGTAVGVWTAFMRFDQEIAWHAARSWLGNAAAPVILLIAAAWTARGGRIRALVVATAVGVVVAVVCLLEYFVPGSVSLGPFEWVGFWKDFGNRLDGTIPSPNALSAQLIVPTMMLLAAALLAKDLRLRAIAAVASIPMLAANYFTFSRSPLLALYVFVVVAAWRIRRRFGIAALAVGLVAGAALLPSYLAIRSQASGVETLPGTVLVATDQLRLRGWEAATRMFLDQPLTGQGYLAYHELADAYGDPELGSPHNEWLRFFAEDGIVVGLLGVAFIVMTTRALYRVPGWLGTGLTSGFLGYVLAASFNNPLLFLRVSAVAFPIIGVGLALAERHRSLVSAEVELVPAAPESAAEAAAVEPATERADPGNSDTGRR